jgi:hypothetical protein
LVAPLIKSIQSNESIEWNSSVEKENISKNAAFSE